MQLEERRAHSRVSVQYPARLWGVDVEGRAVKEDAPLDNLSSGGLYMRLTHRLPRGSQVSVAVRLSTEAERLPALRLVLQGVVVRTEIHSDGACGVAVRFTRRRVL